MSQSTLRFETFTENDAGSARLTLAITEKGTIKLDTTYPPTEFTPKEFFYWAYMAMKLVHTVAPGEEFDE